MRIRKNQLLTYLKSYKFNSIFVKNFLLLLLLIIVPLIGAITMTYYGYDNMQKNDIKANALMESERISTFINEAINEAYAQISYISYHREAELFIYPRKGRNDWDSLYRPSALYGLVKMPIISKNYVLSVYLYSSTNNEVVTYSGITDFDSFPNRKTVETLIEQYNKGDDCIIMLCNDSQSGNTRKVLSVSRRIDFGLEHTGLGIINIDLNELIKTLNLGTTKVYITQNGQIIYSPNNKEIGQPLEIIPNYQVVGKSEYTFHNRTSIAVKPIEEGKLSVISYIDTSQYSNLNIGKFMILFVVLMVVVTFVLCFYISAKIFSPISTILSAIEDNKLKLVREGDILTGQDEIRYIIASIERTALNNEDITNKLEDRILLLKKAQSVALQSQINPHFFNNTLETINWKAVALLGRKNDISVMSEALSSMLRLALDNTDTIISLEKEIEHADMYLKIQEMRYGDKFKVIWDIPSEILRCKTIRIVLQPIIENAIYHGVKLISTQGTITVKGSINDGVVTISVHDNGVSLSESKVIELNKQMHEDMITESKHIGLSNVNQRIKLYFGDEYGIIIESSMRMGTNVSIKFPYIL